MTTDLTSSAAKTPHRSYSSSTTCPESFWWRKNSREYLASMRTNAGGGAAKSLDYFLHERPSYLPVDAE